jgi:hypothetical protein
MVNFWGREGRRGKERVAKLSSRHNKISGEGLQSGGPIFPKAGSEKQSPAKPVD